MDEIGKLLFNCLASRKAVWLPNIGTFRVDYTPARDNGDGTISPPRNNVVFSEGKSEAAVSVIDMMKHEPGGETPSARYDRWLVKVTERGPAVIEGIGVVNNGVFTPYESLVNSLNPIPAAEGVKIKPTAKKGLSKGEKIWIFFIVLFIIILAGGWTWWKYCNDNPSGDDGWKGKNAAVSDNMDRIPEHIGAFEGEGGIVEAAPADVRHEIAEAVTDEPRTVTGNAAPGFYVVGNVFSIPENADKYIRNMQKKYPDLDYVKHPYQGTKTLVSLYSSADRAQANRERRKIEDRILEYDLWLYEVK